MPDDQDQVPPQDDLLEITWDDLNQLPAPAAQPLEVFPAVDEAEAAVAGSPEPWVEVAAQCAAKRATFGVRFRQTAPGVYAFAATTSAPRDPGAGPGGLAPGRGEVQARFDLGGYRGCPLCGQPGLAQCDRCGVIMCGTAVQQDKRGAYCVCPACGGKGRLETGVQVTVQGQVGGQKGKPRGKGGW